MYKYLFLGNANLQIKYNIYKKKKIVWCLIAIISFLYGSIKYLNLRKKTTLYIIKYCKL